MSTKPTSLKVALDLLKKHPSWHLFPIRRHEKEPPLIDDNLNQASNSPEQINKWHAKFPGCNWGVSLKKSDLIVVDVDRKPGKRGQETYDELDMNFGFPPTLTVSTPSGGLHLYYNVTATVPHQYAQGKYGFGPDIDSTNYVLTTGCVANGNGYHVVTDAPIEDAPDWFANYLKPRAQTAADQTVPVVDLDQPANVDWFVKYLQNEAPPSVQGNNGEKALFTVAAIAKDHGLSEPKAVELINAIYNDPNFGKCNPPWSLGTGPVADRLEVKVHNAYAYAVENAPGSATPEAQFGDGDDDTLTDRQRNATNIDFDLLTPEQRTALSQIADDAMDGVFGRVHVDYSVVLDDARDRKSPLKLRDFLKYMPEPNKYICIPTGADNMWPAENVSLVVKGPPVLDPKLVEKWGTHERAKIEGGLEHGLFKTDTDGDVVHYPGAACVAGNPNQRVAGTTWWPGKPDVIRDTMMVKAGVFPKKGQHIFNRYIKPLIGSPPKGVTAKRWLDHVFMLYPDDADHIIQWCAWRVQRPDVKILHALLVLGPTRIGKDRIFVPVTYSVGAHNCTNQKPADIMGTPQFTPYLENVICYIDEARDFGESDRYQFYNRMMPYIGGIASGVLTSADKHVKQHPVRDVVCFVYFSNPVTRSLYLPADDQRFYVASTGLTRAALCERFDCTDLELHERYYLPLQTWYEKEGGNEAVAHYLKSLPLDPLFPNALPPHTVGWHRIVDAHADKSVSDLQSVLDELGEPDAVSVRQVRTMAGQMGIYLDWDDAKGRNHVAAQFEEAEYVKIHNPDTKRGNWPVGTKYKRTDVMIYAKAKLTNAEQVRAATAVYEVERGAPQSDSVTEE